VSLGDRVSRAQSDMTTQLSMHFPDEAPGVVDYLTIAEAAQRIRCCERTIRRAIDSGDLRAGRIRVDKTKRGTFRIRIADLHAWMYGDAP
jgi:excisionase family DNA binding protein